MHSDEYKVFSTKTLAWGQEQLDSNTYFRESRKFWRSRGVMLLRQAEKMGARYHPHFTEDDAEQIVMASVLKRRVVKNPNSFVPWLLMASKFESIKEIRKTLGFDKTLHALKFEGGAVEFSEAHHGVFEPWSIEARGMKSAALRDFIKRKGNIQNRLELKAIAATDGDLIAAAERLWVDTYAKVVWGSYEGVCDAIEGVVETLLKGDI